MNFGGYVFKIGFFKLLNNDDEKYSKQFYSKLIRNLGIYFSK